MSLRTSLSLGLLAAMVTTAPALVGCTAQAVDDGTTGQTSQDLTLVTGPTLTLPQADPTRGLVGRGFNRRAPLSRMLFTPGPIAFGAGWSEVAATDRALCVDFASGIAPLSATPSMKVETRTLMVDTSAKFTEASTFSGAQGGDASVLLPLEGVPVPIPVGGTTDHSIAGESHTSVSAHNINLTLIAKAALTETLHGVGNASINTAVINDVNAQTTTAAKRAAFFAKCGDRFLDQLTMGGAIAIDLSFSAADADVFRQLKAKVNDEMHLGAGGATGSTGSTSDSAAADGLAALLSILKVSGSNKVNADTTFTFNGKTATLHIEVRSLGPSVDTTDMTIDQLLAIVGGWGARVQNNPDQRAVIGAVQRPYTTTINSSLLSGSLPGELDVSYATLMEQVRGYYLTHYMVLNSFSELERDVATMQPSDVDAAWFDDVPDGSQITAARTTALKHAFANAQAMECLVQVAPGSAPSAYDACLIQPVLGDTTTTNPVRVRFPRLQKGIGTFPGATINVASVGNGIGLLYPPIPRRQGNIVINATFDDFASPLAFKGITSPIGIHEDKIASACNITSISGKVVFRSGPADDGDWFTGSHCTWTAFAGLGANLNSGWHVFGTYAMTSLGSNPGATNAPGTFGVSGPVEGTVAAEKWLSSWTGVQLLTVTGNGPIPVKPENLFLVAGDLNSISLAVR